ncbi:MAG: SIS domain-containing protein [Gemmobacter sp.]|uniref:KpsF/GutQ family sugar-phosphate isomerase n=1 Tax=Gemmobacter sp. TaxID=1898957 RepID=UPI00391C789A
MTLSDAAIAATAARVLRTEGQAVLALADALPPGFAEAVRRVLATPGRVVVSGMGKSGHVGRKIAATLASTGTPALFVHPAEASHGDLGMVTPGDLCILLSNSGETAELRDLIAHCARFAIPVVAVSRVPGSTLMRAAQVPLLLPDAPEACGFGMAPTTSTTLQLALGDALALAVMEVRRFRPDQFRSYHPGGRLGAQLSEVHQIMHRGEAVPLVPRALPMPDVILTMTAKGFGIAGLTDEAGLLVGVISDGDLRRNLDGLMTRTAAEVANRAPVTVAPEMLAAEALRVMNQRKIGALFVVEQGRPVGVLHLHDLLRAGVA